MQYQCPACQGERNVVYRTLAVPCWMCGGVGVIFRSAPAQEVPRA